MGCCCCAASLCSFSCRFAVSLLCPDRFRALVLAFGCAEVSRSPLSKPHISSLGLNSSLTSPDIALCMWGRLRLHDEPSLSWLEKRAANYRSCSRSRCALLICCDICSAVTFQACFAVNRCLVLLPNVERCLPDSRSPPEL